MRVQRKVIAMAVDSDPGQPATVFVLTDDGLVFGLECGRPEDGWTQYPAVPGTQADWEERHEQPVPDQSPSMPVEMES